MRENVVQGDKIRSVMYIPADLASKSYAATPPVLFPGKLAFIILAKTIVHLA